MILAGDVGGTKARLAIFKTEDGNLIKLIEEQYKSSDFKSMIEIIQLFIDKCGLNVSHGCLGVPGPVKNGKAIITNLPWEISENEIKKSTSLKNFKLVNDLTATAAAIPHLSEADLINIYSGESNNDRHISAVIAPGTGLGQAFFLNKDNKIEIIPSEGGHSGFAPSGQIQIELLSYLQEKFKRVSVENVLSGPGILNIYNFLVESKKEEQPDLLLKELNSTADKTALISHYALENKFNICSKTIQIFLSILGSHAGNMTLTTLSTGGVYLGGGIPPKIINKANESYLINSFLDKGKLSYVVQATPIFLIKDDHAALFGAAHIVQSSV